jgi:glycosyltransferase involved in cell wall biosynthesis
MLAYRGNPRSGGQGVYVRHLSRELVALGHRVTVFAGRPYPELDDGVLLERLPSLDLYRDAGPFRVPRLREITGPDDAIELATMFLGGFAEPRAFARRARAALRARTGSFDVVHDNQGLGTALLDLVDDGWPVLASVHHPVTIDRALDLDEATTPKGRRAVSRWYGFARMQARVARRLDRIITVSESSRADIVREMGVDPSRIAVVPVGVAGVYTPRPATARVAGRVMTTASADVALKGLGHLLEAIAKLRTERHEVHLVVVGTLRPGSFADHTIARLGLERGVTFLDGPTDEEVAAWYASASVAVVPSLYEGFSLPAVEAMATATPLVATTGGALPEVVGSAGETAILVPPADPSALAEAIDTLLGAPEAAAALGRRGEAWVRSRYSWQDAARRTAEQYRLVLGDRC